MYIETKCVACHATRSAYQCDSCGTVLLSPLPIRVVGLTSTGSLHSTADLCSNDCFKVYAQQINKTLDYTATFVGSVAIKSLIPSME